MRHHRQFSPNTDILFLDSGYLDRCLSACFFFSIYLFVFRRAGEWCFARDLPHLANVWMSKQRRDTYTPASRIGASKPVSEFSLAEMGRLMLYPIQSRLGLPLEIWDAQTHKYGEVCVCIYTS